MASSLLKYAFATPFVEHWLLAGPVRNEVFRPEQPVVDQGRLDDDLESPRWQYVKSTADHFVRLPMSRTEGPESTAFACCILLAEKAVDVSLELFTPLAGTIWVNDAALSSGKGVKNWRGNLKKGENKLTLRFSGDVPEAGPARFALRVQGDDLRRLQQAIPVDLGDEFLALRRKLEPIIDAAYLDSYVFGYVDGDQLNKNEPIGIQYPAEVAQDEIAHRIQSKQGDIYQEWPRLGGAGHAFAMAIDFPLREGAQHVSFTPPVKPYFQHGVKFSRQELIHVVRTHHAEKPFGTRESRREEALKYLTEKHSGNVYSDLARLAQGRADLVSAKTVSAACARATAGRAPDFADLLALQVIWLRYRDRMGDVVLKSTVEQALRQASALTGGVQEGQALEHRRFLQLTCKLLSEVIFPEDHAENGHSGSENDPGTARRLLEMIARMGRNGLAEWNSGAALETLTGCLAVLAEDGGSAKLAEAAIALLDKLLFDLASQQWRGKLGGPAGWTDWDSVLSGRLEPTSGICRLLWGLGNYNERLMGLTLLALSDGYEIPDLLITIGQARRNAAWLQQQTLGGAGWSKYMTADFALACANDYKPGTPGQREHIWQATLGADAIVYANHPSSALVDEGEGNGLWAGNGVLPRARQWGDVVLCLYDLPAEDWMGYTHAYFPAVRMDQSKWDQRWVFGRKGDAYLALGCSQPLTWITTGSTAFREIRAEGRQAVWVCQLGHAVLDGSFEDFQGKVNALPCMYEDLSISFTSLRGDRLELGWEGEFLVNGAPLPTQEPLQYDNPWCRAALPTEEMEIQMEGEGLRLRFDQE